LDRCRAILIQLGNWFGVAYLLLASSLVTAQQVSEIRLPVSSQWIGKEFNLAEELTSKPVECLQNDPAQATQIQIGRLAFESPALLGGQAARMRLSCASCHPSARHDRAFYIEQISTESGTANVAHHFFSEDAVGKSTVAAPIPDLADRKQASISDRTSAEFKAKLADLIQREFTGETPPESVIRGLQWYLAAVDTKHCVDPSKRIAVTLNQDWQRLKQAIAVLEKEIQNSDQSSIAFWIRTARFRLEAIYQRFGLNQDLEIDSALVKSSRLLQKTRMANSLSAQQRLLNQWQIEATKLITQLREAETKSAYSFERLADTLQGVR